MPGLYKWVQLVQVQKKTWIKQNDVVLGVVLSYLFYVKTKKTFSCINYFKNEWVSADAPFFHHLSEVLYHPADKQTNKNQGKMKKSTTDQPHLKPSFFPSTSFTFQPNIISPCDGIKTPWSDVSRPNTFWMSRLISPLACLCTQVRILQYFL